MRKYAAFMVPVFLLIAGCGTEKPKFTKEQLAAIPLPQRSVQQQSSGSFILTVGNEIITAEQIVKPLAEYYRPAAQNTDLDKFKADVKEEVEAYIAGRIQDIIFFNEAKKEIADAEALDNAVEAEVRDFVLRFDGNSAKAEEELKKMNMDWKSFKEDKKKMLITQVYISINMPDPKPVTYSDSIEYYNDHKEQDLLKITNVTLQIIDIQPSKWPVTDPNLNQLENARKLAIIIIRLLEEGKDFGELAKKYSHGPFRDLGGLHPPVDPESLAFPYDFLVTKAGQISKGSFYPEPIELVLTQINKVSQVRETENRIFIIKVIDKQTEIDSFENVQEVIKNNILFDRRRKAVEQIMSTSLQAANSIISNRKDFIGFCLELLYEVNKK